MLGNLKEIGFYTLNDERAAKISEKSPLARCELVLTDKCNFHCSYCKNNIRGEISYDKAIQVIDAWQLQGLKNIRFSGGEPTLYKQLPELVDYQT